MNRKELAAAYLKTIQTLRSAIEHETSRETRACAVKKFLEDVNPIIAHYSSQSIAKALITDSDAAEVDALFNAINGLARAAKDTAAGDAKLSAHYLKCAHELGTFWIKAISAVDTDV